MMDATKERPKPALLQLKPLAFRDASPSCSTPKSSVSWKDSPQYILEENSDKQEGYDYSLHSPYIFKLFQVIVIIVCLGLYSVALQRVEHSIESQLFPQIICLDYLIITPVILLSYLLGKGMPQLLIRIFNLLGGILFFVAGAVALQSHNLHIESFELAIDNVDEDEQYAQRMKLERQGAFLLASGVLCLVNSMLYFADFVWSIHYTLQTL